MPMKKLLMHPAAKPVLFLVCLLPFAWLFYLAAADGLGANPAEALIRGLGDWTLRFLCIVLAVTPLRVMTATPQLARFRRMLGLFVAFYALTHLMAYVAFDMEFDASEIVKDIIKRPFILVGFLALLLLLAMSATSFNRAIRAMGAVRWNRLHMSVYAVAALAILHFYWMRAGKHNFAEVAVYGAILAALLVWRVWDALRKRRATAQRAGSAKGTPLKASVGVLENQKR